MKESNRLYSLDYLRGLAAFGIMIYHYLSWTIGEFDSSTILGRIGRYGVAIFYILSGLTLYYVYSNKHNLNLTELKKFYIKRFFRIYPLLWLTILISILLSGNLKINYNLLFYNITGLFGLFKWDSYIGVGVWSIGNELAFYTIFPLFVILSKKRTSLLYALSFIFIVIHLYFAFNQLSPKLTLNQQWSTYINPLNQIFFFFSGFMIGHFLGNVEVSIKLSCILLLTSLFVFIFYPVTGDSINILTGINRIIFTLLSIIICIAFFKMKITLPAFFHTYLSKLGEASYSLYLMHPIIWSIIGYLAGFSATHFFYIPVSIRLIISVLLTLIVSQILFKRFEKYFMEKGKLVGVDKKKL